QAEYGIRDDLVTGVQTCALPISQVTTELRRTALSAFAVAAARSVHFARFGCPYQLPPKPQETTPADLTRLLGGPAEDEARIRFTDRKSTRLNSSHQISSHAVFCF